MIGNLAHYLWSRKMGAPFDIGCVGSCGLHQIRQTGCTDFAGKIGKAGAVGDQIIAIIGFGANKGQSVFGDIFNIDALICCKNQRCNTAIVRFDIAVCSFGLDNIRQSRAIRFGTIPIAITVTQIKFSVCKGCGNCSAQMRDGRTAAMAFAGVVSRVWWKFEDGVISGCIEATQPAAGTAKEITP